MPYATLHYPESARNYLAGLFADLPTVNLYMLRTQRSDWSGPKELAWWFLKTWCMWSDETTVQPVKVHIWSGISGRGCTEICSFEGIMNAELYTCSVTGTIIQHDCHKSFYVWTNWPTNTYRESHDWGRWPCTWFCMDIKLFWLDQKNIQSCKDINIIAGHGGLASSGPQAELLG